jgi:hypothetical protein
VAVSVSLGYDEDIENAGDALKQMTAEMCSEPRSWASWSRARLPFSIKEGLIGLSSRARQRTHTCVNVGQSFGDRAAANVTFERFFAGDANRLSQVQISDASQLAHRLSRGVIFDVKRHPAILIVCTQSHQIIHASAGLE